MGRINEAIHSIHYLDYAAAQDKWVNRLHPLAKTVVTLCYIFIVLSFSKYQLIGVLTMLIYPVVLFCIGRLSFKRGVRQLRFVLVFLCIVGVANPFFDRDIVAHIGTIAVSGGVVSMVTLFFKGVLTVLASYLLIITTSMEEICYGLRLIRVPRLFVTVLLLIYRYIVVLLKEGERIIQAYEMRAPGQGGLHVKVWGSLIGQLLLRSMDRAQLVYESMQLRGFDGEFKTRRLRGNAGISVIYAIAWFFVLIILRCWFIV